MVNEKYLADTSAIIKYLNGSLPESGLSLLDTIIETDVAISFITEIELSVWEPVDANDKIIYQEFLESSTILGISQEIISETIQIRKSFRVKLPDALIAATAIIHGLVLIADNDKDFGKIKSLQYLNPTRLSS